MVGRRVRLRRLGRGSLPSPRLPNRSLHRHRSPLRRHGRSLAQHQRDRTTFARDPQRSFVGGIRASSVDRAGGCAAEDDLRTIESAWKGGGRGAGYLIGSREAGDDRRRTSSALHLHPVLALLVGADHDDQRSRSRGFLERGESDSTFSRSHPCEPLEADFDRRVPSSPPQVTVQLCSDYGVEPPAHVQPSTSSHPYSSTQALNNPPSHEFTAITSHSKSNSFKDKLPASQSSRNFSLPIQPSQSQSQRTSSEQRPQPLERRSSLPSNSDTALPLANAPVPTSNTASTAYQPTVPRRSASLRAAESNGSLGGKGPTGAMSSQDSIMAGTNGAPRGMAGRVAVGGTDG